MGKNNIFFLRHKDNRLMLLLTAISATVILGTFFFMAHYQSLSNRLTRSVRAGVVHSELFDKPKLISESSDTYYFQDGEMSGTFQLTQKDMDILLSADPPLKYPTGEKRSCWLERREDLYTYNCMSTFYELSIDRTNNQVTWTVTWI